MDYGYIASPTKIQAGFIFIETSTPSKETEIAKYIFIKKEQNYKVYTT